MAVTDSQPVFTSFWPIVEKLSGTRRDVKTAIGCHITSSAMFSRAEEFHLVAECLPAKPSFWL